MIGNRNLFYICGRKKVLSENIPKNSQFYLIINKKHDIFSFIEELFDFEGCRVKNCAAMCGFHMAICSENVTN